MIRLRRHRCRRRAAAPKMTFRAWRDMGQLKPGDRVESAVGDHGASPRAGASPIAVSIKNEGRRIRMLI
jgi:hypothetical protein